MTLVFDQVIPGIVANAITSVMGVLLRAGWHSLEPPSGKGRAGSGPVTAAVLRRAAASYAKGLNLGGRRDVDRIRVFLVSSEVDSIVHRMFSTRLADTDATANLESLRRVFLLGLSGHLGRPEADVAVLASGIFDALLAACDMAFESLVSTGTMGAHEARTAARHRMVLGELAAIEKHLQALSGPASTNASAVREFERRYRSQVAGRHAHITPPDFDSVKKVKIDDLYVPSLFIPGPQKGVQVPAALASDKFLAGAFRAVILGTPGAGKSTFMQKLCHDMASDGGSWSLGGRRLTPFVVVLRDYGSEKKARNCSILEFIEATAKSTYQLPPPTGAVEYMLVSGMAAILFDGLDELIDASYRREISGDVESFTGLYPSVPVLVTSREVGYEQAPLSTEEFETYRISPFEDEQVAEYVKKWFALDTDLPRDQQKKKAAALLSESSSVPDLRSNPLMLALMCNIYRGESYIPRNRPAVYEKCAVMLFERWDRSRGIRFPLPFEEHIDPCIKHLAHWIYSDATLQGGVGERRLVEEATRYLCPRRFEDPDEARRAAEQFIAFCRGRAWVFTDTGTDKDGERLYQFTHRTFLEYFTAAHLVRANASAAKLSEVLIPRIAQREWDVVAQLACQLLNKNVEGAGDELLCALEAYANAAEPVGAANAASFAGRCLEFLVPSPRVTRQVTTLCLESVLSAVRRRDAVGPEGAPARPQQPSDIIAALVSPASENLNAVRSALVDWVQERILGGPDDESLVAAEIGFHMGSLDLRRHVDTWDEVRVQLYEACGYRMVQLAEASLRMCSDAFWRQLISVRQIVEWHGVHALFEIAGFTVTSNMYSYSPADYLLTAALRACAGDTLAALAIPSLREAGTVLLAMPKPLFPASTLGHSSLFFIDLDLTRGNAATATPAQSLDADALFGMFMCLAVTVEYGLRRGPQYSKRIRAAQTYPSVQPVVSLLLARAAPTSDADLDRAVAALGFSAAASEFARHWASGQASLLEVSEEGH